MDGSLPEVCPLLRRRGPEGCAAEGRGRPRPYISPSCFSAGLADAGGLARSLVAGEGLDAAAGARVAEALALLVGADVVGGRAAQDDLRLRVRVGREDRLVEGIQVRSRRMRCRSRGLRQGGAATEDSEDQ